MVEHGNIIVDRDVSLNILKELKIAVIGYGNQGRAQALNLKDSGLNVKVGLRNNSSSLINAKNDGFYTLLIKDAVKWADLISIMLPDKIIPKIYENNISPHLIDGKTILFSHGYCVHYNKINIPPKINVIMVAPSSGGSVLRKEYKNNYGVPALLAVYQDCSSNSWDLAKAYAKGLGCTRVCAFKSTFKEETETDLFGEQAILTGGLPYLIKSSYNALVNNGYSKTVAWFVCYYELKTIVDLMHGNGFEAFYKLISDTARYGGVSRGNFLIDDNFKVKLQKMIDSIKSGDFDKELSAIKDDKNLPDSFKNIEIETKELLKILKKDK